MAAGKMIVSTPITDVVEPYGDMVYLGGHAGGVHRGVRAGAERDAGGAASLQERMREVLQQDSWDFDCDTHAEVIEAALKQKRQSAARRKRMRNRGDRRRAHGAQCGISSGRGFAAARTESAAWAAGAGRSK